MSKNLIPIATSSTHVPVDCSDFKVFALASNDRGLRDAVEAINSGQPNKYIGNGNTINALDQTPLIVIIRSKNIDWVKIALKAGADPNLPNVWRDDNTKIYPLTIAFEEGCHHIVNLLLEAGAWKEMVNLERLLSNAIWPGYSYECTKIAISLGAKVTREHAQLITWRYRFDFPLTNTDNANYINIWKYLYQVSPNIVNFKIGRHNWDNEDMTFAKWLSDDRLEGHGDLSKIVIATKKPEFTGKWVVVKKQ